MSNLDADRPGSGAREGDGRSIDGRLHIFSSGDWLPIYDIEDDLSDAYDHDAEAEMNCGRYPDGGCSLAGTWECEAECPYR